MRGASCGCWGARTFRSTAAARARWCATSRTTRLPTGRDGQGESFLPDSELPENPTHAVNAIIDLIRQQPGEITLVCLAPMTNIAMALRLAPDIKDKIVEVIAISGAFGLNEAAFLNATATRLKVSGTSTLTRKRRSRSTNPA